MMALLSRYSTISHTNLPKEAKVGTTRRVVRERRLSAAHVQADDPPSVPT